MTLLQGLSLFWLLFTLALLPTASSLLVAARAASGGFKQGAATSVGVVLGDLCFIGITLFGLIALAQTFDTLFTALQYIGAAYLCWLGYGLIKDTSILTNKTQSTSTLLISLSSGLLITLGDMKAIFFYASVLPSFINSENMATSELLAIAIIDVIAVGGAKLCYAYFASASQVLSGDRISRYKRPISVAAGVMMLGLGGVIFIRQLLA